MKLNDDELAQTAVDAFGGVITSYIDFLAEISDLLVSFLSEEERSVAEIEVEKRKFSAIKKELYNFLSIHKEIFTLYKIELESDDGKGLFE